MLRWVRITINYPHEACFPKEHTRWPMGLPCGQSAAPTMTRPDNQRERVSRDRGAAFERFSRAVDGPMMILALAMIPLIVVPLIMDLSPGADRALVAIDYLIWAAFTVEYVVKLCLAPDRWRIVKANISDLVIVVVPMLRPAAAAGDAPAAAATPGPAGRLRRRGPRRGPRSPAPAGVELGAADRPGLEPDRRRAGAELRAGHAQRQHPQLPGRPVVGGDHHHHGGLRRPVPHVAGRSGGGGGADGVGHRLVRGDHRLDRRVLRGAKDRARTGRPGQPAG